MQQAEEEIGIGELSFGRDTDEPIFKQQSPELDEREREEPANARSERRMGFDVAKRSLASDAARDVG